MLPKWLPSWPEQPSKDTNKKFTWLETVNKKIIYTQKGSNIVRSILQDMGGEITIIMHSKNISRKFLFK